MSSSRGRTNIDQVVNFSHQGTEWVSAGSVHGAGSGRPISQRWLRLFPRRVRRLRLLPHPQALSLSHMCTPTRIVNLMNCQPQSPADDGVAAPEALPALSSESCGHQFITIRRMVSVCVHACMCMQEQCEKDDTKLEMSPSQCLMIFFFKFKTNVPRWECDDEK